MSTLLAQMQQFFVTLFASSKRFFATKTWPNNKMPVWAWCAITIAGIAFVVIVAVAASASSTASQPVSIAPQPAKTASTASQATRFQITAVDTTNNAADVDFVVMVDSYSPTTDVDVLQQENETIIAAWKQDNPKPSAAPYYITYSSINSTGKFIKRAIRTFAGAVYLMFSNTTSTSDVNVPVDNTGTWTYLYDGKGTARVITFAEVPVSTGLIRTIPYVQTRLTRLRK